MWEFEFPLNATAAGGIVGEEELDEFNYDGGSVSKLPNGRYVVGFTNMKFSYGLKVTLLMRLFMFLRMPWSCSCSCRVDA